MDVSGTCVWDTGPFLETFTFLIKVKHTSCAGCKGGCLIYILVTGLNRQPAPKQQEKHMHALRHYLIITETSFITAVFSIHKMERIFSPLFQLQLLGDLLNCLTKKVHISLHVLILL